MDWVEYFLDIAETVSRKSKDPSTKVGCVVVGDGNSIVSTGYNSFARGVHDRPDNPRWERPAKYKWVVHAELNALLNAARTGARTEGCTAIVQVHPCSQCANALVNAGIKQVIVARNGKTPHMHTQGDDLMMASTIFQEAGVTVLLG